MGWLAYPFSTSHAASTEITLCVSMWMTCHVLQDVIVKSLDALG